MKLDSAVRWRGAVLGLFLLAVAGLTYACLHRTDGHFAYALDDPYIHLSIARNLASHRIWGVTPYAPSAASSSPLWTVLLAAASVVFGAQVWLPFVVNLLFACLTAWRIQRLLTDGGMAARPALLWTLLVALAAPFATLAFTGMEHSLQVYLVVLWIATLLDIFQVDDPKATHRQLAAVFVIGFALMLARFESAFLFVVPFFAGLARRDFRLALAIAVGPLFALGAFMSYCHLAGMPLLPNSIVLKGNVPRGQGLGGFMLAIVRNLDFNLHTRNGYVVTPLLVSGVLAWFFLKSVREASAIRVVLATLIAACLLHAAFAYFGNFYRYEAYVVVGFAVVLLLAFPRLPERKLPGLGNALGLLAGFLLVYRAVGSMIETPRASRDIYIQQIQMARFVRRYYDGGRVALNDIGAVSYFAHIRLLDLWGLASDDVRELKQRGIFDRRTMKPLVDRFQPDVTIVYPIWFTAPQDFPANFVPVADWSFPSTTTSAFNCVEFFASTPAGSERLRSALADFAPSLPRAVRVTFVTDRWPHR